MSEVSESEKRRILAIAGNPHNGAVFPLLSIPNGYRIISRVYSYDPVKKRSANQKVTLGVVIDDKYMTKEEYHSKFTKRGFARVHTSKNEETAVPKKAKPSKQVCPQERFYQRLLGAVPILYGSAVNCGIAEDLSKIYGATIAQEILSLAIHWVQDRRNAARCFSRFSEQFALPFSGIMDENQLANLYSSLGKDKDSLEKLFAYRFKRLQPKSCISIDSNLSQPKERVSRRRQISKPNDCSNEYDIRMSVLAEQKTGMPLMYNTVGGTNSECMTVFDVINRAEELSEDRELLFSFERTFDAMSEHRCCSMDGKLFLKEISEFEKNLIDAVRERHSDFYFASSVIPGTSVNGHSEKIVVNHQGRYLTVWAHVFRSQEKTIHEKDTFFRMLDGFENSWKQSSEAQRQKMLEDCCLARFYEHNDDLDAELVRAAVPLNEYGKNLGFFAIMSLKEMTTSEALNACEYQVKIASYDASKTKDFQLGMMLAQHRDTMEGRFVVAFVALTILAELKRQLSIRRTIEDKRKKFLPENMYSIADVIDITAGTTINYDAELKQCWTGGMLKEHGRLCLACGFDEDLYSGKPSFLESWSSLR